MNKQTIIDVNVKKKIKPSTRLLKVRSIDTGEVIEMPFDETDFDGYGSHDEVIKAYQENGLEIINWTSTSFND